MAAMERKVRVDTSAIDGLRGLAVFHIIVGHLFLFSNFRELWTVTEGTEEVNSAEGTEGVHSADWSGACPSGWLRINSTCYGGICDAKLRDEAESTCAKLVDGGHLFSVSSVHQMEDVVSSLFSSTWQIQTWVWTGAKHESGVWKWSSGEALPNGESSKLWADQEPNNHGGVEDCTATYGSGLYDVPCGGVNPMYPLRFICEVAAKMDQCESPCPEWVGQRHDPCPVSDEEVEYSESCGTSGGIYLMGGGSMGLFYIISGFVMAVGYCQAGVITAATQIWASERGCCVVNQVMLETPSGCAYWSCFCWPVRDDGRPATEYGKLKACDFWMRRLVRLAPMYFLTNLTGILLRHFLAPERETVEPNTWDSCYVLTSLGLTSWAMRFPMGNELTWTISTMLFFYLCFPALAPRIQRLHPSSFPKLNWAMYLLQLTLVVAFFVILEWNYWVRMIPLLRFPIFIMGICCGLIRVHQQRENEGDPDLDISPVSVRDRPRNVDETCCCCALEPSLNPLSIILLWFVSSLFCSVAGFFCNSYVILFRFSLEVAYPILFFYWVLAFTSPLNQKSYVVRFFKSRFMRFLGDISLCAYMIHMILAEVLGILVGRQIGNYPWWTILAVVPSTIILGWCFTTFYEKPIARCIRPDKRARRYDVSTVNAEPPVGIVSPESKPDLSTHNAEPPLVGSPEFRPDVITDNAEPPVLVRSPESQPDVSTLLWSLDPQNLDVSVCERS